MSLIKNAIMKSSFIITKNKINHVTMDIFDKRNKPFNHIYSTQPAVNCSVPQIFRSGKILRYSVLRRLGVAKQITAPRLGAGYAVTSVNVETLCTINMVKWLSLLTDNFF